jgi:hypothetical protein
MINLRDNIWAVEVPDDADTFELLPGEVLMSYDHQLRQVATALLPTGTWGIVCTSKSATEAIAEQIVESDGTLFKCYAGKRSHISPLRSLFCLMDEQGCDMNKHWLILKKQ